MDARILLKYSASRCNKELLSFLHENIDTINGKFKLKVIIVYDDLIPKLKNKVNKLPVLIINGKPVTGNSAIRQHLTSKVEQGGKDNSKGMESCDLENYWHNEMRSGVDEDSDDNLMDIVKSKALEQSIHHRENSKAIASKGSKKNTVKPTTRQESIKLKGVDRDKISDIEEDPFMKGFWDNQETTPGCD
jgi:hypothetical protein